VAIRSELVSDAASIGRPAITLAAAATLLATSSSLRSCQTIS
jgi:hypothetical protein